MLEGHLHRSGILENYFDRNIVKYTQKTINPDAKRSRALKVRTATVCGVGLNNDTSISVQFDLDLGNEETSRLNLTFEEVDSADQMFVLFVGRLLETMSSDVQNRVLQLAGLKDKEFPPHFCPICTFQASLSGSR